MYFNDYSYGREPIKLKVIKSVIVTVLYSHFWCHSSIN